MSDGLVIDIEPFIRGMELMEREVLDAMERGAARAGEALLADATLLTPTVPIDEGTLRGSGSVFVNANLTKTAQNVGGNPTPATETDEPVLPDAVTVVVGYNTPYAAYQHEGEREDGSRKVENYTDSGAGAKFLEKPLFENAQEYQAIVGEEVKKVIGNA